MKSPYARTREGYEHRLLAEKALGRPLPAGAEVHHVNHTRDNSALVICPDRAYHMLLHYRERALEACGNPNFVKCEYCKSYGDPGGMYVQRRERSGLRARHRECHANAAVARKARKRGHIELAL